MDRILTLEEVEAEDRATGRKHVAILLAGIVIGALVLQSVLWAMGPPLAPGAPSGGTATVRMAGIAFVPGVLNVAKGTTVTWVNEDAVYHTVTSDLAGGPLASPNVNAGQRWTFTFTEDGTYGYHCTPHSSYDSHGGTWMGMTGKIVVGTGTGGGGGTPVNLPHTTFDARTAPLAPGTREWNITLVAKELPLPVGKGVPYAAWTFNGQIPGPALRVRQGDTIHLTLRNEGTMNHSIDFHSARINWASAYRDVPPGTTHTYSFTADYPGVFMYHCGSGPVLVHVANGMYGTMIVEPASDPRPVPDREYVLVLSEVYASDQVNANGLYFGDVNKMLAVTPTQVVFNGYAFQYHPGLGGQALPANAGDRIRVYVLNAGPSLIQSFHVIGAIFDAVYIENNPSNRLDGIQTWTLPSSGGAAFDLVIPDPGLYPFVTHNFAYTGLGAVGVFAVT